MVDTKQSSNMVYQMAHYWYKIPHIKSTPQQWGNGSNSNPMEGHLVASEGQGSVLA